MKDVETIMFEIGLNLFLSHTRFMCNKECKKKQFLNLAGYL